MTGLKPGVAKYMAACLVLWATGIFKGWSVWFLLLWTAAFLWIGVVLWFLCAGSIAVAVVVVAVVSRTWELIAPRNAGDVDD